MSVCVQLSSADLIRSPKKCSVWELAEQLFPQKADQIVGAFINNQADLLDLRSGLEKGDRVQFVWIPSEEALPVIRHSAAHVMAQAVQELWPDVKVTIGPVIENGFYYDFDSPRAFRPQDLQKIEEKMRAIIRTDCAVTKEVWTKSEAISFFKKMNEPYKVEIINELQDIPISVYRQGEWLDLCKGPHVKKLSQIGAIKVLSQSGAYWRGDENKKQLQRIYGTASHSEKQLKSDLKNIQSAELYDHRLLGKAMDLFYFSDLSPGSPFFTARGTIIYNELKNFLKELYIKYHYQEVITPQMFEGRLFECSGHKEHFAENMYPVLNESYKNQNSDREFFLKPMNCPGHCLLYRVKKHSYRELPWKVADFGRLHRKEKRGALHGLTRVNSLCQDDAHVFCTPEQLQTEITLCLNMFQEVYHQLGLTIDQIFLSTRPKKSMGGDAVWQKAQKALTNALSISGLSFKIQEGEGAFYGPKLDWQIKDAMRRPWQLGTLQCDFNMPQAFKLRYTDKDNQEKTPILLHRAILGSLERFIGVYLEHTKGYLPLWLSPVSVLIVNISKDQEDYAKELEHSMMQLNLRVRSDLRSEKLGYKIRESRLHRQPCVVVVGNKEKQSSTLSVRLPNGTMCPMPKKDFIDQIKQIVHKKIYNWDSILTQKKLTQTKGVSHS